MGPWDAYNPARDRWSRLAERVHWTSAPGAPWRQPRGRIPVGAEEGALKGRILVVDDDPGMRETLADIFSERGFEVLTAEDGLNALNVYEEQACDLILMDIRMPHLNGVEVLRRIRARSRGQPVVLMTAYSMEGLLSEAQDLGAQGIMAKPLDWTRLLDLVSDLVETKAQR